MGETMAIKSVGYAGLSLEELLDKLPGLATGALLVETRSVPFSRRHPQFNQDQLKSRLGEAYLDCSKVFGARTPNPEYYSGDGQVDFSKVEKDAGFQRALNEIKDASRSRDVVLLCACKHPERCHRTLLVAEALHGQAGIDVEHIHSNGSVEMHSQLRARVAREQGFASDMFRGQDECEKLGIEAQRAKYAYTKSREGPEMAL